MNNKTTQHSQLNTQHSTLSPKGASYASLGQRPRNPATPSRALKGRSIWGCRVMPPLQGLIDSEGKRPRALPRAGIDHTVGVGRSVQSVDLFLNFNNFKVLTGAGTISHQTAKHKAHEEYDQFNKTQTITSDFDQWSKELGQKGGDA